MNELNVAQLAGALMWAFFGMLPLSVVFAASKITDSAKAESEEGFGAFLALVAAALQLFICIACYWAGAVAK